VLAKLWLFLDARHWLLKTLRRQVVLRYALTASLIVTSTALATWQLSTRAEGGGPFSQLPPGKAALLEQQAARLAQARQHLVPKPNPTSVVIPTSPPPLRQAGIIDMRQGPFEPTTFRGVNAWRGPLHGETWVLAYAGQREYPRVQGALYVELEGRGLDGQFTYHPLGYFLAPTGQAALRIVGWSGTVLSLRTATGATIHFDVATNRYQP
jgi:hypothetical protein